MGPRRTRNVRPGAAKDGGNSDLSRVEHQKELAEMLHERALERLREGDVKEEKKEKKKNPIAYRSEERFPRDKARELKILIGTLGRGKRRRPHGLSASKAPPSEVLCTQTPCSPLPRLPHRQALRVRHSAHLRRHDAFSHQLHQERQPDGGGRVFLPPAQL